MALQRFKEITDNKGYSVTSKDRKIFERELRKSLFGLADDEWFRHGKTDVIEFILYDSNDNQLPQGEFGKLVRYIYLDDANIETYFFIDDDPDKTKINESRKYVVNTEKLINEAGYSNGIFKTQITLLNRRIGSEDIERDKVWIHEISPSRTEIRVLPVKNEDDDSILPDLKRRYDVFIDNGEFRDDTIAYVKSFITNMDIQRVLESFLKIKGKVEEGQTYVDLIKVEFGISNFDDFLNRVKTKYTQAMINFVENRDYDIHSLTYGKEFVAEPDIELSVDQIEEVALTVLQTIIDEYLPNRDISNDSILSREDQETFDQINQILKTTTVNSHYESTIPPSVSAEISGCTNPDAMNYNPLATVDDGSCQFINDGIIDINNPDPIVISIIRGCTNPDALNYNQLATVDDGSCTFLIPDDPDKEGFESSFTTTKTWYVWSTTGRINYTDSGGRKKWIGIEYESVTLTYRTAEPFEIIGDIREYPKIKVIQQRCQNPSALNYGEVGECVFAPIPLDIPTITEYPVLIDDRLTQPTIIIGGGSGGSTSISGGSNFDEIKSIREDVLQHEE